jgi:hypothetical protein
VHAQRLFGKGSDVEGAAGALMLHYMLDTVAFYTDASRYLDFGDPVVGAYVEALEQRHQWMPQHERAPGEALERQ